MPVLKNKYDLIIGERNFRSQLTPIIASLYKIRTWSIGTSGLDNYNPKVDQGI